MIFESPDAVVQYIRDNQKAPGWVTSARAYSTELCALVNGEDFIDLLISSIENIESEAKAKARRKYARDMKGFFARQFLPIQNVFAATGGVKDYQNSEVKLSADNQKRLLNMLSNIRDGKSIERYIETQWMNLYHTDPAGVLWMRYKTDQAGVVTECYPTYQSIGAIRTYSPKGQLVDCILYEPYTIESAKYWIVVDDKMQYTIKQLGEAYSVVEDPTKTFVHPFGEVPVIINSNIVDKLGNRLSPIHEIIPIAKEYARDQSIKTIYKFLHGFPKSWVMDMMCGNCGGSKKAMYDGAEKPCKDCGATGWRSGKLDVADIARIPFPKDANDPVVKGDDIMGYSAPDLETWKMFNEELKYLECEAFETNWGVEPETEVRKTATEVYQDQQPKINKLNKYADACEWIEWIITEWLANAIDTTKDKSETIALIVYGRRYILEGIDTIQKKYEDARKAGDNAIILDGIFDELLTVKFKNDPEWMRQELKKSRCEPYLHHSATEINNIFGANEAAKKIYFQEWWKSLTDADLKLEVEALKANFKKDFDAYFLTLKIVQPINSPTPQPET